MPRKASRDHELKKGAERPRTSGGGNEVERSAEARRNEAVPVANDGGKGAGEPRRRQSKSDAELLDAVMEKIEDTVVVKPSVGDLLRLMQARKEIQEPAAREIKVQWVEPQRRRRKK